MSGSLTRDELAYMRDLAILDEIRLGMRAPSLAVRHPEGTQERCIKRGLARFEPDYAGGFVTLTTKGARTLRRVEKILARI